MNNDEHHHVLEKLAQDTAERLDGAEPAHPRDERGNEIDIHFIREMTYALHTVSIGTHQLLYFSAMKYVKNHFDIDTQDREEALRQLAKTFDTMNVGTLKANDDDSDRLLLRLDENALAFRGAGTDKPTCYFISGYIAGFLENALGENVVVNEIACKSQGNDTCIFKVQER